MTQKDRVYDYMVRFGGITALEAMTELGVFRLASRICDLKRDGVKIKSEWVTVTNRFGEDCRVVRYSLIEG